MEIKIVYVLIRFDEIYTNVEGVYSTEEKALAAGEAGLGKFDVVAVKLDQ